MTIKDAMSRKTRFVGFESCPLGNGSYQRRNTEAITFGYLDILAIFWFGDSCVNRSYLRGVKTLSPLGSEYILIQN